jgi:hypothetical protein
MGDNSFFIEKARSFFEDNADILVLEGYFSEPETSLANSIWGPSPNAEVCTGLRKALVRITRKTLEIASSRRECRSWGRISL